MPIDDNFPYSCPRVDIGGRLVRINGLDRLGFEEWVFTPGMLFNAPNKWWGDGERRDRPHEGLDLYLYREKGGAIRCLDSSTSIPLICAGEVLACGRDFLGVSLYVGHDVYNSAGNRLCSIYGHVTPAAGMEPGALLDDCAILGTIADASVKRADVPSHLHISVAWVQASFSFQELSWATVGEPGVATLVDPLQVIRCEYTVLTDQEAVSACLKASQSKAE